jgi:L-ascorbate metabolism protein UlaG (beta-lactamase superfamily)
MKYEVIHHASIKFTGNKIIYFDPYKIEDELHDADYIFITHDHYDHYDLDSINNIRKETTKIILPKCLKNEDNYLVVEPDKEYKVDDLYFKTIRSYNTNKSFHPREKEYVGYNILLDDKYYYIMGDTDRTPEAENVKTDVCFVPIGGVYTMTVDEAVNYINDIKPSKAIPIHYGLIVGDKSFGNKFKENVKDVEIELFI